MDRSKYKYFKIDVHGPDGYSFLVGTKYNETEETIVDVAFDCGAYQDASDALYATAERVEYGDYDYKGLEETLIYLDAE